MTDWEIRQGHVLEVLRAMPAASVQVCVTSPPYWGLRAYKTEPQVWGDGWTGELGSEPTIECYVEHIVAVFREVRRVLRRDATCWINIGDGYQNKQLVMMPARLALALQADGWWVRSDIAWCKRAPMPGSVTDRPTSAWEHVFLLSKNARYYYDADAVREASTPDMEYRAAMGHTRGGTNGRDESRGDAFSPFGEGVIEANGRNMWNYWTLGPEPFPEAHFATFPTEIPRRAILAGSSERGCCPATGAPYKRVVERGERILTSTNKRAEIGKYDVDEAMAHAYYREDAPMIAGAVYETQTLGWEPTCGAPWRRVVETRRELLSVGGYGKIGDGARDPDARTDLPTDRTRRVDTTIGWEPTCTCGAGDPIPCTVLDPFSGSGTTGLVALRHGRRYIGIELNAEYVAMSERRIRDDAPLWNAATPEAPPTNERAQLTRAWELFHAAGLSPEHLSAIRAAGITDTGKATVTQNGTGHNTERVQALAAEAKEVLGGYYRELISAPWRDPVQPTTHIEQSSLL